MIRVHVFLILLAWMGMLAAATGAAEPDASVSSQTTYVDMPVTLQISIPNATTRNPPEIPEIDGLSIQSLGRPMISSQTYLDSSGRRTSSTSVVHRYEVTPERTGTFTIPPIQVTAGGIATITKAVRIEVLESETGDLMFVEIAADQDEVFVGQATEVTLRIWIKPYRDQTLGIGLNEGDTWRLFSQQSRWGKFAESLNQMAKDRQRPGGRPVTRDGGDGNPTDYFLYEIGATVYPTRPGPLDVGNVRVVVDYPTEIGRRRDSFSSLFNDAGLPSFGGMLDDDIFRGFGSRMAVTKVRPVLVEPSPASTNVKPIPERGRPASYRGAVGQYSIITQASPIALKVGEPITLKIGIDGTGPMDGVLAPPLSIQPDLVADFKVPDESLAGFVDGDRKVFATTIRPLRADVTEIPPIELSYFDPEKGQFVTTRSSPIKIQVQAAEMLELDKVVAGKTNPVARDESSKATAPAWAEFLNPPKSDFGWLPIDGAQPPSQPPNRTAAASWLGPTEITCLAAGPILFAIAFLASRRDSLARWGSSKRRFERAIDAAKNAGDVAAAATDRLATRYGLPIPSDPNSNALRDRVVGRLRASGQSELAVRLERIYASADRATSLARIQPGDDPLELDRLKSEARSIASTKPRKTVALAKPVASSPSATAVLGISLLGAGMMSSAGAAEVSLTTDQRQSLVRDAERIYAAAQQMTTQQMTTQQTTTQQTTTNEVTSADQARNQFALAAEKLQVVVDSGDQDHRVYFNLASAYFRAGQRGRAIANLRRAIRMDPDNDRYSRALQRAEPANAPEPAWRSWNRRWVSVIGAGRLKTAFLVSWLLGWLALIWKTLQASASTGRLTGATLVVAGLVAVFTGVSYGVRTFGLLRDGTAVLVGQSISVRDGDGTEFPEIIPPDWDQGGPFDGQLVRLLDQRGGWSRVELPGGVRGWVNDDSVEKI